MHAGAHLAADGNQQAFGRLQLQLCLAQQQTQDLHQTTLVLCDVHQGHPVDVARQGVQRRHAHPAMRPGLIRRGGGPSGGSGDRWSWLPTNCQLAFY